MTGLAVALREAAARLAAADIASPMLDARLLLLHATGLCHDELIRAPARPMGVGEAASFEALIRRRLAREPVDQLIGMREFWGRPFRVTRDTLSPRPDSEALIDAVTRHLPPSDSAPPRRILDLGTGTGCLLLTLLHLYPQAEGIGVDRSAAALAIARENAARQGLNARAHFAVSDWAAALGTGFDLAVSNPPYIETGALTSLEPEIREHEPRLALDGGADGLDAFRALLPALPVRLTPGALVALEIGPGQGKAVIAIARQAGLDFAARERDLADRERCLLFRAR